MTRNPLINALVADLYIVIVSVIMNLGSKYVPNTPTILGPVAFISLFTLSAAVMGYLFLYQPLQLYFDNKKKDAVDLFLKTLGVFGIITIIFLVVLFSGVLK